MPEREVCPIVGPLFSLLYGPDDFIENFSSNHNSLERIHLMTSQSLPDAAAVEKIVAHLSASRPAYASILNFYGPVFTAQVKAAAHTRPAAIELDESITEMKLKEGFALIVPVAFTVDCQAAGKLLAEICAIAEKAGEKLAGAGKALALAMEEGTSMEDLFRDVLDDKGRIHALAEKRDVSPDMLSLLLYLAVKPSLEAGARQLSIRLASLGKNRDSCPICGSAPIIGELDAEGNQWTYCGLCWHRWPVKRLACPFCDNRDDASLEYVYSEDEPEYRINLCGGCRRYLKVVDTRKMERGFYPPLEQVASLHLDMMAAEKGFSHAVASPIPNVA